MVRLIQTGVTLLPSVFSFSFSFFACVTHLSAGQRVSGSLQQCFDQRASWQLLISPRAHCDTQQLLHL